MATAITMQRDFIINVKRETFANVRILNKVHPMSQDLTRQVLKDNALDKPTQNVFNHLAYYLVSIIDPPASRALPWPLYDSKTERAYRNALSTFITEYGEKGLLTPVMASYLVNPACYKVTMLIFQLSQVAVQRVLESKMKKACQKKLYNDFTNKCKSFVITNEELQLSAEKEIQIIVSKRSKYLRKREAIEKIAKLLQKNILQMEALLKNTNAQIYIDNLVDGYIKERKLSEQTKADILEVKNVCVQPKIFEKYLLEVDEQVNMLELEWERKTTPFLNISKEVFKNTETLIARHTGADQMSFTIEYNHKADEISTVELQKHVNSEQKYILKNIVCEQRLNFPNLVRGFLISMSFILKNTVIGGDIYGFNKCLDEGHAQYCEIASSMRRLIQRVMNAESRLKPQPNVSIDSVSINDLTEIPPLPDLADLKMNRGNCPPTLLKFNHTKQQFNLRRKMTEFLGKPLSKSFLITPMHRGTCEDFLKSVIPCHVSAYDQMSVSHLNNTSNNVRIEDRANETRCKGFTKQQLNRLLSTKKSSAKKHTTLQPGNKIKKRNLFNETTMSTFNASICMTRSHSSPNLLESKEKTRSRRLSTMKEDSLPVLEVSGIVALNRDSNQSTPRETCSLEISRKVSDFNSLPSITGIPNNTCINCTSSKTSLNEVASKEIEIQVEVPKRNSTELCEETKTDTPVTNARLIKKTGSLEKIINRFKKIRASVLPEVNFETKDFKTIDEEKENLNMVHSALFKPNRNLLPDLLSPSCSTITQISNDQFDHWFDSDDDVPKRPRESLGAALGVDHTFLDQFDLDSD